MKLHPTAHAGLCAAIGILLGTAAAPASAIEFELGDGWKGNWNTTLSFAQSWRAQRQNNLLYSKADGLVRGFTNGLAGSNTDSGNLNYDKNNTFGQVLKFTTDVSISKDGTGGLVRVKGWYDNALIHNNVPFGNQAQRPQYSPGQPLSDEGLLRENQFWGFKLMDAYAFTQFNVAERPVQVRVGNQVINWGESLFLQGLNITSPIDLPALRRGAGTEIKEFLIPVTMAYGNVGLPNGMSLEGFYQLQWQRTVIDACGTYFAPTENAVAYQTGNCNIATTFGGGNNAQNIAAGSFYQLIDGPKPSNSGQWGLAFRFPVQAIDTEFGLYYQNLASRVPFIGIKTGIALPAGSILFAPGFGANRTAAFWEYPEDVHIYGLSASTNVGGWSVGAELSYAKDLPAQINGNDLVAGFIQGAGPIGAEARALAGRIPGVPAAPLGTIYHGYDRFNKTQLQFNAVKLFSNVLGAENLAVVGEFGMQWNNVPNYKAAGYTGHRYGRGFIFGNAISAAFGLPPSITCLPTNPQPDGCQNDGFVTRFSDGMRLRGTLTYNDIFGSGVTMLPTVFWAADFEGYSIDTQFLKRRSTVAPGVRFEYQKRYSLDFTYVTYADGAKFDNLRDRDFYSIGLSVTF